MRVTRGNQKPKPLTASASAFIIGEIRKLDARGLLKKNGGRTFVKCPFHNENTPSCMLTTNISSKYEIGSFKCWGCGEGGGWNKLAEALGVEQVGVDNAVSKKVQTYDDSFYTSMLNERYVSFKGLMEDLRVKDPVPMKPDTVWRTLPAKFIESVKGCMVKGIDKPYIDYLFLPNYINGELVGGVRACIKDPNDKNVVKYKNSSGTWSRTKGLYPYDPVAKAMDVFERRYGFRALVLVEGARDSLVFNCEGIPTLGLLGTQSWSPQKLDNVLDLEPEWIGLCMDGDRAGIEAEESMWLSIKKMMPCWKADLRQFNKRFGKDIDPGNAPPEVIDYVWSSMMKKKTSLE